MGWGWGEKHPGGYIQRQLQEGILWWDSLIVKDCHHLLSPSGHQGCLREKEGSEVKHSTMRLPLQMELTFAWKRLRCLFLLFEKSF